MTALSSVPIKDRLHKRYTLPRQPDGMSLAKLIFMLHGEPRKAVAMAIALPVIAYCLAYSLEPVVGTTNRIFYFGAFFAVQTVAALLAGARMAIVALVTTNVLLLLFLLHRHPDLSLLSVAVCNLVWLGMIWVGHHSRSLIIALKQSQDELKSALDSKSLMTNELNHRVKNTLAQTQAIVTMTKRNSTSIEDYHGKVIERLMALSKTHNLLTDADWGVVNFRKLINTELDVAQHSDQIKTTGRDLKLSPKVALALGLALHELVTNAQKYGALSHPDGCLDVHWSLQDQRLIIHWCETTAHKVETPTRMGFGSRLIRQCIQADLGGNIDKTFRHDGLKARIEVPLNTYETGANFF